MARTGKKLNERITQFVWTPALVNTDRDIRVPVPGDATKLKHWKVSKGLAGAGTAVITLGAFSGAGGTGTRIMADLTIDIDAAAGNITTGADTVTDAVTFADGDICFLFANFDAGTITAAPEIAITLIWQV